MTVELSVVVPTLNETGNVGPLIERLEKVLDGCDWEVIFVDDQSTDGTQAEVIAIAQRDSRVRLMERIGRRGLSSACIEGMMASTAPFIAVMDADLQHDETLLPKMLAELKADTRLDMVIGSRFIDGGGIAEETRWRLWVSKLGKLTSRLVLPQPVADPMSGFFILRREFLRRHVSRLWGRGFKILVDLLSTAGRDCRFKEIPYEFRSRRAGYSKLNSLIILEYFVLLAEKMIGHIIPIRFLLFVLVGSLGLCIHLAVLAVVYLTGMVDFWHAQVTAGMSAMVFNFVLNNVFTYRDYRLRGWRFVRGFVLFCWFCSFGFILNVTVAILVFEGTKSWLLAGLLGGIAGALWNYSSNSALTWRVDASR